MYTYVVMLENCYQFFRKCYVRAYMHIMYLKIDAKIHYAYCTYKPKYIL